MYKMQHLDGSGKPVLYIGRTVFEGYSTLSTSDSVVGLMASVLRIHLKLYTALTRRTNG